jgi:hypothetical protein
MNPHGVIDTGTHRVSTIPSYAQQSGNPATCPYKKSWRKEIVCSYKSWQTGLGSGATVWDATEVGVEAEVHNLAKQNAGVHACRAQPTVYLAILNVQARRRPVPLKQSWQHLAKSV